MKEKDALYGVSPHIGIPYRLNTETSMFTRLMSVLENPVQNAYTCNRCA